METVRLSKEGQVIIPMGLRVTHKWEPGQEFEAIDTGEGILLKPKKPFSETTLANVAGCLRYEGPPKTLQELDDAVEQAIKERWA